MFDFQDVEDKFSETEGSLIFDEQSFAVIMLGKPLKFLVCDAKAKKISDDKFCSSH